MYLSRIMINIEQEIILKELSGVLKIEKITAKI